MKLDIYGRFQLEIRREGNSWVAYRLELGKRMREKNLILPPTLAPEEIPRYVDDLFHELAGPGQVVRVIA
jgi:hypothetical protein